MTLYERAGMRRHEDNNAAPSRWRLAMVAVILIGTPVLIMWTSAMRNTAEIQHFYEHAGGDGARSDLWEASGERDDGPAPAPPSFQSIDADAGIGISGYVDDSIGGETVPFFMYPDMANISSRLLDCLTFGTGIENEDDAAKTTAWFREVKDSPPAQYIGDMAMFAQLERSPWRTHDPEKAMIFYVPVLYGLISLGKTRPCAMWALGEATDRQTNPRLRIFQRAIDEMESMPYAQRRRGFDHAWTMTFWGDKKRFMVNEDRSGSPEGESLLAMIERGIYFSRNFVSHFYPHERRAGACIVVIPFFASSLASKVKLDVWPRATSRAKAQHVAYFRGSMSVHIRLYKEVRKLMLRISEEYPEYGWSVSASTRKSKCEQRVCNDEEKEVSGVLPEQMMREMSRSTFCLIPGGDAIDSQRLSIAFAVNCIPVIVARDYIDKESRDEYTRRFEAGDGVSTREDFFYYAPFSDIVDYSSFAVLVDPIEFTHQPDTWLPDKLAAIAANATLMDSLLLGLAKAARHLVFTDIGSDAGNAALLSASRHCLTRPTDRLPTAEERSATFAAGASWANDETLNFLYDDFTGA